MIASCWHVITPSPGIVAEGGSSVSFVNRSKRICKNALHIILFNPVVGLAKANEVLIWGKKKSAEELLSCGFLKYGSLIQGVRWTETHLPVVYIVRSFLPRRSNPFTSRFEIAF